ncbi:hypothetical protein PFICI_05761 [Pestalotiopsis fici W106-1]|uniref:Zn(2)-C6 fungal-type domain-containing protein n=1 Tax=Pestalotiopsis fici (strain W106-1 / CGMCC3.15140) TaxID=1229662 RepID=W3XCU6_PESFW|nr:uncharacterized protein PFICI_05761 [Pestalotiopsis fici W106-1]ETS83885.1 hypothetical protein PFICI_05761 [Pestalotiopsis fici W106-1]
MEQSRQRFACDRCHTLKLRCPRVESTGASCARCSKAGSLCVFSAPARLGRPLGSSQKSLNNNTAPANHHQPTANDAVLMEHIGTISNDNNDGTDSTTPLDDFLPDMLSTDAASMDAWNNASVLLDNGQMSVVAQHDLPLGPLQFSPTHKFSTSRCSAVSPEHQRHLSNTMLDQYEVGNTVEKCLECSTAMMQTAALDADGDTIQDIMSQLSSLIVASHGHRRLADGQLRLLQLRLKHKHAVVDEALSRSVIPEDMTTASDYFTTRNLIRTQQSFRDVIRRATRVTTDSDGHFPSPVASSSRGDIDAAPSSQSFGTIDRRYTTKSTNTSPTQRQPTMEQSKTSQYNDYRNETSHSCVLALKLILNCYSEILDIFATTFAMIETTINHYPSFLPISLTVPAFLPSSGNMMDASFSIFTANQLTQRLFEMTKKDMQDMWDRHNAHLLQADGDSSSGDMPPRRVRSSLQDSVIQMTFQLSWEKEASIARVIEDIGEKLNELMDMS